MGAVDVRVCLIISYHRTKLWVDREYITLVLYTCFNVHSVTARLFMMRANEVM